MTARTALDGAVGYVKKMFPAGGFGRNENLKRAGRPALPLAATMR